MNWKKELNDIIYSTKFGHIDGHEWSLDNSSLLMLEEFITSLLKQQREICAEQMVDRDIIDKNSFAYKGILNAPEPEGEIK